MRQVETISVTELKGMAANMYDPLVKAVVDIKQKLIVVDAEMHVDEEQYLLEQGSDQADLWGINLWPDKYGADDFIEYDSMINIRPRQENNSRDVESPEIRDQIKAIINEVIYE